MEVSSVVEPRSDVVVDDAWMRRVGIFYDPADRIGNSRVVADVPTIVEVVHHTVRTFVLGGEDRGSAIEVVDSGAFDMPFAVIVQRTLTGVGRDILTGDDKVEIGVVVARA